MVRVFDRSGSRIHYLIYRHYLARMQVIAMGVSLRGNHFDIVRVEAK